MEGVYRLEVGAESLVISGSYREMSVNAAYSKVHVTLGSVSVKIMSPVVSGVWCLCLCLCLYICVCVWRCTPKDDSKNQVRIMTSTPRGGLQMSGGSVDLYHKTPQK